MRMGEREKQRYDNEEEKVEKLVRRSERGGTRARAYEGKRKKGRENRGRRKISGQCVVYAYRKTSKRGERVAKDDSNGTTEC